jgi:hypothetical protein
MIDYATVGMLLAAPRMLGASPPVTRLLTGTAMGVLGHSVVTRYELSAAKLLPMPAHLAIDAVNGLLLCAAPLLFPFEPVPVKAFMAAKGVAELGVTLLSQTRSSGELPDAVAEPAKDGFARVRGAAADLRERVPA